MYLRCPIYVFFTPIPLFFCDMQGHVYQLGDFLIRVGSCRKGAVYKGLVLEVRNRIQRREFHLKRNHTSACIVSHQSMSVFIFYATLVCCCPGGVHANLSSRRWIGHDRGFPAEYRPEREICCCQRTSRSRNVWAQPDVLTETYRCADD